MDEIQLGLGARDLRRNRRTIVGLAALFGVASAATWWVPTRGASNPEVIRGAVVTGYAVLWLLLLAHMMNQARGKTRLTPGGLQLESYLKHRAISWADVVKFEERRRTTRGGAYWDVRVHCASGRPVTLPGLFTSGHRDRAFEDNLVKLYLYWAQVKDTRTAGWTPRSE